MSKKRAGQNAEYTKIRAEYLAAHPFCMVGIRESGADEAAVIAANGFHQGKMHRPATQIHHRNKCRGLRKIDTRFFLAVCSAAHAYIEQELSWARSEGYVLPFEADINGRTPDGTVHLQTPEFMKEKVK